MSTFEKISNKFKNLKHKELIFFVIIIVLIIFTWFLIKSPAQSAATVSYSDMTAKEELSHRINEAVNALTGDTSSKIIIYWDTKDKDDTSFSSMFNGTDNNDSNVSVQGIAVVCKNGDNAQTKVKVTFMLSKVFNISADRISVYGKK